MDVPENEFGWRADPLYEATGHPSLGGQPDETDARADPFHTRGPDAYFTPTQQFVDDSLPPAADIDQRALLAQKHGVEGSWGDRASFMRAHYLVPDTYRHDVVAARARAVALAEQTTDGDL